MKKFSLLLVFFLYAGMDAAFAGYLNTFNLSTCSFYIHSGAGSIEDPVTGTVYNFTFGPMTVSPGANVYSDPTLLPGFSSAAPANLQASGCVISVRLSPPEVSEPFPGSVVISTTPPFNTYTSTNTPACNSGVNYAITLNTGNGCDVVLLIL